MDNIGAPPVFTSNNFFAPLLVSMAGVACASIAIFLYNLFLVKYCRRRRRAALHGFALEIPDCHLATGLDPKLLETIPIMPYLLARQCDGFRLDQSECVVCLGELEDGDVVRLLPNCRHAFHVPCIDRWFVAHSNCPVCRSPLISSNTKCNEDENNRNANSPDDLENICDGNNDQASSSSSSSSGVQMHSCGLLRHCASLVLPTERRSSPKRLITGLKRSFSMDLSFVVVDMQMEDDQRHCSSSSSSSSKEGLTRSRSIRQFDLGPSRLRVSLLSRFRMGIGTEILPY